MSRSAIFAGTITFIYLTFSSPAATCQDTIPEKLSVSGYITNMQSFTFRTWEGEWITDNTIHNRLNFKWHNKRNDLNAVLEMRNRFISGESVKTDPGYSRNIESDDGFFSLSNNVYSGNSNILNLKIDRLYLDYTIDNMQIRAGRQRINWGQCSTWNPNDLFNSYSFFDFDYIEKPGCDALKLQYYPSGTSDAELAISADSAKKVTIALLYRFSLWNYDFQFIGGYYKSSDYVIGTGWSGNIKNVAFRGEISYFLPKNSVNETSGTLVCSLGGEYTFGNSLSLQCELLYNKLKDKNPANFTDFYNIGLTAKKLSFTEFTMMLGGSYPITPLLNVSLSAMYFPEMKGFFAGPEITYSLSDNTDFSVLAQSFGGKLQTHVTDYYHFIFLRLKYTF
jgi:hypothetical protein